MSQLPAPASVATLLAVAPSGSQASATPVPSISDKAAASTASEAEDLLLPALGLPPIPASLVQSIKAGKFVDFGELVPEALREAILESVSGQKDDKKKKKQLTGVVTLRPPVLEVCSSQPGT